MRNLAFASERSNISECERVLQLIQDIRCVCGITPDECERVRTRTEVDLPDDSERKAALLRNASRLGVLVRDLDEATSAVVFDEKSIESLASKHGRSWEERIQFGATDLSSMLSDLDARRDMWRTRLGACQKNEDAEGNVSSSYSDYSDESTESDDDAASSVT